MNYEAENFVVRVPCDLVGVGIAFVFLIYFLQTAETELEIKCVLFVVVFISAAELWFLPLNNCMSFIEQSRVQKHQDRKSVV